MAKTHSLLLGRLPVEVRQEISRYLMGRYTQTDVEVKSVEVCYTTTHIMLRLTRSYLSMTGSVTTFLAEEITVINSTLPFLVPINSFETKPFRYFCTIMHSSTSQPVNLHTESFATQVSR